MPSLAGTCGKIAFVATTSADCAMLLVELTAPIACGSLPERSYVARSPSIVMVSRIATGVLRSPIGSKSIASSKE